MSDDPIGAGCEAAKARAEIRAAGISCPSCGVNMADLPHDHRLVLDHGGVNWERAERRVPTAKCTAGTLVLLDGASFETWQAAANVSLIDDYRSAIDAEWSRMLGWDVRSDDPPSSRITGFLDVISPEAGQ